MSLAGQIKGSQRAGGTIFTGMWWHPGWALFALLTYRKLDLSANNVQSRFQYCCYLTKEDKEGLTGKNGRKKAGSGNSDLSYSWPTGWNGLPLLICSMTSVRSVLVSWGRQQLLCRCACRYKEQQNRSQIPSGLPAKTQLREKCQYWPLNIRVKIVSLQRIILKEFQNHFCINFW